MTRISATRSSTGQGGRDENTGRQIKDQELKLGNAGLVRSQYDKRPVRVIRGSGDDPRYSPDAGYRYDGLFRVVDHWHDSSRDGPRIWRFHLVKITPGASVATGLEEDEAETSPGRSPNKGSRVDRDPAVAKRVKEYHGYRCQVCSLSLQTATGPHAEGAHIKGLGHPHNGPDIESNMLCLCRNDHFLLDAGSIYVDEDWQVWDALTGKVIGPLRTVAAHKINPKFLRYHRDHYGIPSHR